MKVESAPKFITPGMGNSLRNWVRLVRDVGKEPIPPKYWSRVFLVGLIALLSTPFQWYERLRLKRKMAELELEPDPVFIIGHWRSGTTHLHNILSQDPQFAHLTTLQGIFPRCYQTNFLFPWLTKRLMPSTRPMDNMKIGLHSPQEEEIVMVNGSIFSFYHFWHFPRQMRELYFRMAKLSGIPDGEREEWERDYLYQLKKAALQMGRGRLVLKNPPNTVRIPILLKMFPRARFIYLHRDPREVFGSTKKMHGRVVPYFNLQEIDQQQIEEDIVYIYRDMLETYLRDRELIPENQLIEVAYRDLVEEPDRILREVYQQLHLGNYDQVRAAFREYVDRKSDYRVSRYDYTPEEEQLLEEEMEGVYEQLLH